MITTTLLYDMAQIYQQRAADSLDADDLAHAKRYRMAGERIEQLEAENAALREDAERLDLIEQAAAASRSGVSFDYARFLEGGYVVERGFRMMEFHKIGERYKTLREAIDSARSQP